MKAYILKEITGDSYNISTHNTLVFLDKKKAQEYFEWIQNFIRK